MTDLPEADRLSGAPHPREQHGLIGHSEAEALIRDAWDCGRMPHSLLISGPEGIGKATLAYRIARFVLSDGAAPPHTLDVPAEHPASRQVTALAHPDMLLLRRTPNDSGKLPTMIPAEQVRRVRSFFGSTAALGGWRVCIVDSMDEMNAHGANALLKTLEEPPARSLFILVSHAPGRLLPTIRSRCRHLSLRALDPEQVSAVLGQLADKLDLDHTAIADAVEESGGSVREALVLLSGEGIAIRRATRALLDRLPDVDLRELHTLGEQMQGDRQAAFEHFTSTVEVWISDHATGRRQRAGLRLARLPEVWEKVRRAAVDADTFNLDRKSYVFRIFASLDEAVRP